MANVQVPLLALHTAAWNWPQPERFWPERWTTPELRGGPKAGPDGLASAFLPCGASCISAHVAEAQVRRPNCHPCSTEARASDFARPRNSSD